MVHNLTSMKGLWLIKGLCKGFLSGKDSIYEFPTLHNLPCAGTLWFHKIKSNPSKSKRETIIVNFQNLFKWMKVEDVENVLANQRHKVPGRTLGKGSKPRGND
ncbi:uncharacterized protein VP01_2816g3 [Puccinia sorghi]|uniref:5'-3' exoribonuclease 1 D1 domain-containing protein n=1 Tax=Puccinia sorghi TaxID=27349 RepID=A0A0L6V346_9BASI|nr:uncharacterized protein VP01_2816g3 [Puccinia sorghi]